MVWLEASKSKQIFSLFTVILKKSYPAAKSTVSIDSPDRAKISPVNSPEALLTPSPPSDQDRIVTDLDLYQCMQSLELLERDLCRFSYPRHHPHTGKAQIYITSEDCTLLPGPHLRTCRYCKTVYQVQGFGHPFVRESCTYHWGNLVQMRRPSTLVLSCCKQPHDALPCYVRPRHLSQEENPYKLTGFVSTRLNYFIDDALSIYSLACGIVYTINGLDVGAISIVDSDCRPVYETLVRPGAPIIDYNTEFTGLTEKDFNRVRTRRQDVKAKLLSMVGMCTILVGHALNEDLIRLKLIHDHVVDTSVLYPHPQGLPVRYSLASLNDMFLGNEEDKNSIPTYKCRADAEAAMKLAISKCQPK